MRDLAWTKSVCSSRIPDGEGQISKSMVGMQTSKCRSASIPRRLLTSSRYPLDAVRASIIQSYCSGSKQPSKMIKGETGRERGWWKRKKKKKRERKEKLGEGQMSACAICSRSFLPISFTWKGQEFEGLLPSCLQITFRF